ncbi:MAG: DNA recombination protein RmuC [Sphingobium sp.]
MDPTALGLICVALLAGIGAGWFVGARPVADLRRRERAAADGLLRAEEQRNAALRDIDEEQKRGETLRSELEVVRSERDETRNALAAFRAESQARAEAHDAQLKSLIEAKEQLSAQFSEIGNRLLGDAQRAFLERADQRFSQANEKSEAQLRQLLQPVETTLKRYEDGLDRVEKDRVDSYAALREAVEQVRTGQGQVREETAKLVNALRAAPKTRGRWGEQQFKNLIETAGLSAFVDFHEEVSVASEEGRLRPDFVIRLPGDQQLVVDVKCSLTAYLEAVEQSDPIERDRFMSDHARAVRTHADVLGRKAYWEQFEKAPDFVIMYIPGDNFVTAALESDMELWERAAKNRVIICGPATFLPLARTLASHWRQARMQDQAKKVGQLGKELYDRLSVAASHLKRVGSGLNSAVENYNKFVGSFDRNVLSSGRKFRELDVETGGKEIETVEPLDVLVREPQAEEAVRSLPSPDREAAE